MGTLVGHFQQRTDQRSGDAITHKNRAACIAMGLAGSLRHCNCGLFLTRPRATEAREAGCFRCVSRALSIHITSSKLVSAFTRQAWQPAGATPRAIGGPPW